MAIDLEGLRTQVLDSIKGRKFGLDYQGYLAGPPGLRDPITAATSLTTGTNIVAYGITTLQSASAATAFKLEAPVSGIRKTLVSMSTGGYTISLVSGTFQAVNGSSAGAIYGSSYVNIVFTAASSYQSVHLQGLSSSVWQVCGPISTGVTFT